MAKIMETEGATINSITNGTVITGNVTANGDFRLDGQLDGDAKVNGLMEVGEKGVINGNIICQRATIMGTVVGNISVKELLSLSASACVKGDILINQLSIAPGATFSGSCRMIDEVRRENEGQQHTEHEKK